MATHRVPCEDSDTIAHSCKLIRVPAVSLKTLLILGHIQCLAKTQIDCAFMQADQDPRYPPEDAVGHRLHIGSVLRMRIPAG